MSRVPAFAFLIAAVVAASSGLFLDRFGFVLPATLLLLAASVAIALLPNRVFLLSAVVLDIAVVLAGGLAGSAAQIVPAMAALQVCLAILLYQRREAQVREHSFVEMVDDQARELSRHEKSRHRLVSGKQELERQLAFAQEASRVAELTKKNFLANINHELRTPLNGIIGMMELLLETDLQGRQYDLARTVDGCANSLLTIVNELLDLAKMESMGVQLEALDFNLTHTIEDTIDQQMPRAEEKQIDLMFFIHPDVPNRLNGDPARLRQLLGHLLDNAVKFTKKGKVLLQVVSEENREQSTKLRFTIIDTGIGIAEDVKSQIHQTFTDAHDPDTADAETGVGLSICRRLVTMMGGKLGMESTPNKGSHFWFSINFKHAEEAAAPREDEKDINGLRLLVAESDGTTRQIIDNMLMRWGVRQTVVGNTTEALDHLRAAARAGDPYRVALLDYRLQNAEAEHLPKLIRDHPLLDDLRLILLTTDTYKMDPEVSRRLRFSAFLCKPLKPSMLYDCLSSVTSREPGFPEPDNLKLMHRSEGSPRGRARILVVEDIPVNQKVALRLLDKLGYHANVVPNGMEAVRITEVVPYDLILMDIHMPEMGGFEAARRIRARKTDGPHLPIIALTANVSEGVQASCAAAGMDGYLCKPLKVAELRDKLNAHLGTDEKRRRLAT